MKKKRYLIGCNDVDILWWVERLAYLSIKEKNYMKSQSRKKLDFVILLLFLTSIRLSQREKKKNVSVDIITAVYLNKSNDERWHVVKVRRRVMIIIESQLEYESALGITKKSSPLSLKKLKSKSVSHSSLMPLSVFLFKCLCTRVHQD